MTNEQIKKLLQKNELLKNLSQSFLDEIISIAEIKSFNLGDTIINSGDSSKEGLIIINGKTRVTAENKLGKPVTLFTRSVSEIIGFENWIKNYPFEYNVRASSKVEVLSFPLEAIKQNLRDDPQSKNLIQQEFDWINNYKFLRTHELFNSLKLNTALELLPQIKKQTFNNKEKLYTESENGSNFFLIIGGSVKLIKESLDNRLLFFISQNEIIGESVFIEDTSYFETAIANEKVEAFVITKEIYAQLVKADSSIEKYITGYYENQQRQYETILAVDEGEDSDEDSTQIFFQKYSGGLRDINILVGFTSNSCLNGIACLKTLLRYYKINYSTSEYVEEQLLLKKPDTLKSLSRKIEASGLLTQFLYINKKQLESTTFPALISWGDEECVMLLSVSASQVVLSSPAKGLLKLSTDEFYKEWNHKILTVNFVPDFGGVNKSVKKIASRFLPLLKPYKNLLVGLAVLSLFLQLLGIVTPIFSKTIIDKVLVLGDRSLLYSMLLGMLVVTAFQLLGNTLRTYLVAHAMRRISATMQFRFLKHILQLPRKIFIKWQVGDFTTRFQENDKVLQLVSQNGFKIIIDSITILIYLVILLSANSTLTGYSMIFIGGYAILMLISSPILRANDIKVFEAVKDTESFVIESVGNIAAVKSMASEKVFYKDGMKRFIHSKLTSFRGAMFAYNVGTISSLLNQASVIVVLGLGANMVLSGQLTTGELIFFNMTLGLLLAPLNSLISMWDEIQELRVAFERLNDVLLEETEPVDNMIITEPIKGNIKIEELFFKYNGAEKYTIEDISLNIVAGQKVALVGRSGSGKSTLVNLLMKMYNPVSGKIYFDSRDISEVDNTSLRNQIGFVEQTPFLFNGTIKENLTKSNENISYNQMVEIAKIAGVDEFVSEMPMQYDTQIGEKGVTLSGGQRQRIVIARALMNNPKLLILDEATSALDTESERIIQQNLDGIMKDKTTIIIAHRLSTIKNANKIIVMDKGKIVESGTHDELMEAGGLYYYLIQKSSN